MWLINRIVSVLLVLLVLNVLMVQTSAGHRQHLEYQQHRHL